MISRERYCIRRTSNGNIPNETFPCDPSNLTEGVYYRPIKFQDKRVMVVGIGNTAADTATALCGIASQVYLSHQHGALVVRSYVTV